MKVIKYHNVTELNITFVRFEITRHKAYCRKKVLMKHKFYSNHGLIIIWDTVKTNHKPSHGSSFSAMKHANLLLREYSYGTPATVSSRSRTSLAWSGSAVSHSSS